MNKITSNIILTALLTTACITSLFFFNRAAAPQQKVLPTEGVTEPDYGSIITSVTQEGIRSDLETLCATDSRFPGTPGCDAAAEYIKKTLTALGYEVLEQSFSVVAPQTKHATILDEAGRAIDGLQLVPMLPNWFRTTTVPPEGATGKVYRGLRGLASEFEGINLSGNIVLLPIGVSWSTVASMGARAVLYYDDGRETVTAYWNHHGNASMNMPRFLVRGDALALEGKTVTIQARVDLAERPTRNIIGILEVPDADEAIVINSYYDSYSYTPDLAPGAEQACSPAALLSVARHLASEKDDLNRTVIVLATAGHGLGLSGAREFARALGVRENRQAAAKEALDAREELEQELALARKALSVAEDPNYWAATGEDAESDYWQSHDAGTLDYFTKLLNKTLDFWFMAAIEAMTQARVNWVRAGMLVENEDGSVAELFRAYDAAREQQTLLQNMVSTPAGALKKESASFIASKDISSCVTQRGRDRLVQIKRKLIDARAREATAKALSRYSRILFLGIDISSKAAKVGLACGTKTMAARCMPADVEVMVQIQAAALGLDKADEENPYYTKDRKKRRVTSNLVRVKDSESLTYVRACAMHIFFESMATLWSGYTSFTLSTPGDIRHWVGTPFDNIDRILEPHNADLLRDAHVMPLQNLETVTRIISATASRLARGHGRIVPTAISSKIYNVRGQVLSRVGDSLTPDHAMPGSVVKIGPLRLPWQSIQPVTMPSGIGSDICTISDWDGHFEFHTTWPLLLSLDYRNPINIDAAMIRPSDGEITWALSMADCDKTMPYSTRGIEIAKYDKILAMPVLFRAASVQAVPMIDPATLTPYAGFSFIESKGLAAPKEQKVETYKNQYYVCFVPPETRLYFTFKKGSLKNKNLTSVRAFALGATGPAEITDFEKGTAEVAGEGYLAADSPSIINIELDTALSMAQVNSRRTALQQRYNMADDMIVSYNKKALELAEQSRAKEGEHRLVEARHLAQKSVAYSSNIHPVIRKNTSDAILGILFYLLLAIPFAVFMERLIVGHPDIRVQIAVQGIIFLLFFLALRMVHPAYQLVRSSYMILLGFVTFTLSIMVGCFVATRFASNVSELRKQLQERAESADVSRASATITAFLLGLGHMRKRPVRTGLTVGTLILTTFVMLCFTSVDTDVVDIEYPIGNAPYTGLFFRDRAMATVASTLGPLRELYDKDHIVAARVWVGTFKADKGTDVRRASYVLYNDSGDRTMESTVHAYLGLSYLEPKITQVTNAFEIMTRWFESDHEFSCFLPRVVADELRIRDEDILAGTATAKISGKYYTVLGVFNGDRIGTVLDLDGQSILPLDVLGLMSSGRGGSSGDSADVPEDIVRLPGDAVVIMPNASVPGTKHMASIAVAFQNIDYVEARRIITAHLERSAVPGYYGIDGISFYGGKFRMSTVGGLLELLLPVIIAAMTVLNTMRGSVYERKDELYVFNAVGLSPSHIRALFIAEASVYAVVGAVGGYLLAQGIGAGLRVAGVTAGLTMNYSSLSSVLVSIVIMLVVYVSSIFPARMAAQLAAPAELMTRERSTSEGDVIEMDLPFTFNRRDRVGVIPYFVDWFEDYGEGSAGAYFCSEPECGIEEEDHGGAAPFVKVTTWLKPYDLGVSQDVKIIVRHLSDAGDNVATVVMTRLSGDIESWERCCHAFIGLLRKRFLTWRAVDDEGRDRLLLRGRDLLEQSVKTANENTR